MDQFSNNMLSPAHYANQANPLAPAHYANMPNMPMVSPAMGHHCPRPWSGGGFTIIVVLFILLIIVGASAYK